MLSLQVSMTESDSKVKDNNRNKNSWAVILQVPWWLHLQSCFHFAVSLGKCFKLVLHIPADPFLSPFLPLISTSTDNHCRCASYAVQNRSEKKMLEKEENKSQAVMWLHSDPAESQQLGGHLVLNGHQ